METHNTDKYCEQSAPTKGWLVTVPCGRTTGDSSSSQAIALFRPRVHGSDELRHVGAQMRSSTR
ncbi:MAG: hypothetical protein EOO65_02500 [Methanosarcinales archaeon]|nr:MAG: hypothetical protein EOO65_02500 [Methanosarcinales archaeon]